MKRKGIFISAAAAALFLALAYLLFSGTLHTSFGPVPTPDPRFRTLGQEIQIQENGRWEPFEVIGVNIGTGYPGRFPNEFGIEQDTYFRWFEQISDMNANTIRTYKLQSPAFYTALLDYNRSHDTPLYLIQGMDFPEQLIYSEENILDPAVHAQLFRDSGKAVDALHGDGFVYDFETDQLHLYTSDVSEYVLGYILGIEWDELFVEFTCRMNEHLRGFHGTYLTCVPNANAFEIFLAQWGEHVLAHETERYGTQPLLSFCNWPDTDPFLNELSLTGETGTWQKRRETPVDLEHIRPTSNTLSGIFASYNVYPYFPSFLQYGQYANYVDETGTHNPYRSYLMELTRHHSYPVVISEYGIPASRSRAYGEVWRGFSHGGLSEEEQGYAAASLFRDIRQSGCAGSIVFTWQDEWYKTIWNEKMISDPDRRAYWSNAQCAEQFFGLLAFEPGEAGTTCYPDGDLSDWSENDLVSDNGTTRLSIQQDEKYLYFLVEGLDQVPGPGRIQIALDILPGAGTIQLGDVRLDRPVDFLIQIDPAGDSGVYVDASYDLLPYSALGGYRDTSYSSMNTLMLQREPTRIRLPEHPAFVLVSRADGDIYSRLTSQWIVNPVGRLIHGNTNPESDHFASNADFYLSDHSLEVRIPWQLLNFTDPSKGSIADVLASSDFEIRNLKIDRIYAAVYFDGTNEEIILAPWELTHWETPHWHERLKESYYILKEVFGEER